MHNLKITRVCKPKPPFTKSIVCYDVRQSVYCTIAYCYKYACNACAAFLFVTRKRRNNKYLQKGTQNKEVEEAHAARRESRRSRTGPTHPPERIGADPGRPARDPTAPRSQSTRAPPLPFGPSFPFPIVFLHFSTECSLAPEPPRTSCSSPPSTPPPIYTRFVPPHRALQFHTIIPYTILLKNHPIQSSIPV
jgi:hypothetical protein